MEGSGGEALTPKERVARAVNRQETDRVPLDFDAVPSVVERLMRDLGCASVEDLLRYFHSDMRMVWPGDYIGPQRFAPDGRPADCWGMLCEDATYAGGIGYRPLAEVSSVDEVYAHGWPDPDDFVYSHVKPQCDAHSVYSVRGSSWAPVFCQSCNLCGMETMLQLMACEPEIAQAILDCVTEVYAGINERMFDAAEGGIDVCFMGDDFGCQRGMLMSPDMWRRMMKPNLARLFARAKERGMMTMLHSCGAVSEIIPDLIEIGVDILDPIQVRADGMDPVSLKTRFGDRIAFHGAVDTQLTLPYGSADDVRAEVGELIRVLGEGGGFILSGSQWLTDDIPTDNVVAMYDEARRRPNS